MSFRRDGERALRWQRWLDQHRDALVAAGLPSWVYAEELRWIRFLEEGGTDWESGWQVELLFPQQAERFRRFILQEYGPDQYRCCVRSLKQVVGRAFSNEPTAE
jgi:hypothetical protein